VACSTNARRVTPYQGEMLNARTRGAEVVDVVAQRDGTIAAYVRQVGRPDFVVVPDPDDVELVYYDASRLVHFHRTPEGTERGELSPLPLEVVNVLPLDIRAGTPGRIDPEFPPSTGCWHVRLERHTCRTCCKSSLACSTACRADGGEAQAPASL
jgi:hypothetical protein